MSSQFTSRLPPERVAVPQTSDVDSEISKTFATAYSTALAEAADRARERAKTGWAVTSAIAGAIVAGGLLGGVTDASLATQLLTTAAFGFWLMAAWHFLVAVTQASTPGTNVTWVGARGFIEHVTTKSLDEGRAVAKTTETACQIVLAAMVLTVCALFAGLFWTSKDTQEVSLPASHVQGLLPPGCSPGEMVSGTLDSREDLVLQIKVTEPECAKGTTLLLSLPAGSGLIFD